MDLEGEVDVLGLFQQTVVEQDDLVREGNAARGKSRAAREQHLVRAQAPHRCKVISQNLYRPRLYVRAWVVDCLLSRTNLRDLRRSFFLCSLEGTTYVRILQPHSFGEV